eukprot:7046224-Karenia_brevis.AAC.1
MDGRQTAPRAEMTAVIRALLAIKATGLGITHVTIWSDSKIVVQGYNKGCLLYTSPSPRDTERS